MKAFSPDTDRMYEDWDALVAVEANGYVVVALFTKGAVSWPWVMGPYPSKPEAERARARTRTRLKREQPEHGDTTFSLFVRPAWKDVRT